MEKPVSSRKYFWLEARKHRVKKKEDVFTGR
jgi:hypothetical protein